MFFESFDGKKIHVWEWGIENPKGIVQIIHGMAEHAGRYERFAKFLNGNGYYVVADDHRGHGKTDRGSLGYCKGDMYADTLRDEGALTDYYQKKYAGLPYFILGFSYGSFLAQSYIARYGEKIDGAVIAGSSYKKDFEVYFGSLVAFFGKLFCGEKKPAKLIEKASFGAYAKKFGDGEWLSNDAGNNRGYRRDPLCGFVCSFRFYADFFRGLRKLYTASYRKKLRRDLPVLIVSGAEDAVGNMGKGTKKLASFYRERAGMKKIALTLFENSRHEFLNEADRRAEKWGELLAFFNENCAQ